MPTIKLLTISAALLLAAPAQAQALELTPSLYQGYAELGASVMGLKYAREGDYAKACMVYQHKLTMESNNTSTTAEDIARTRLLISKFCMNTRPVFDH